MRRCFIPSFVDSALNRTVYCLKLPVLVGSYDVWYAKTQKLLIDEVAGDSVGRNIVEMPCLRPSGKVAMRVKKYLLPFDGGRGPTRSI